MSIWNRLKTFFHGPGIVIVADGVGEKWNRVTTTGAAEESTILQTDAKKIEVINLDFYDGSGLSGRARVALISGDTADTKDYIPLASGKGVIISVGEIMTIYYKREAAAQVSLLIRELRI